MRVPTRDVIVVGASAGGVEALRALVAGLRPELPATVLVVLHIPSHSPSVLPRILSRSGPLPARSAVDGEPLAPGHILVAPADHHLLLLDGRVRLSRGPHENGHRPAVDVLFRSAAHIFGPRVTGVVLSGARDDGAAGLQAVVDCGGTAVVQDPADALHPSMPRAALDRCAVDFIVPADRLGQLLSGLTDQPVDQPQSITGSEDRLLDQEVRIAAMLPAGDQQPGRPAGLACPSCHGALFEVSSRPVPRFRCWVGHAWSAQSLLEEQGRAMEAALWMAMRALDEKAAMSSRLARSAGQRGHERTALRFQEAADQAQHATKLIRDLIGRMESDTGEETDPVLLGAGLEGAEVDVR